MKINHNVPYFNGDLLRTKRKEKGLTLRSFADLIDANPSDVSKWETGSAKPRLKNVEKLASVLGVKKTLFLEASTA